MRSVQAIRTVIARSAGNVYEFFALPRALQQPEASNSSDSELRRRAALRLFTAAERLQVQGQASGALTLYREASLLLVEVFALEQSGVSDLESLDPGTTSFELFRSSLRDIDRQGSHSVERLAELLTLSDPIERDRVALSDSSATFEELVQAARWVSGLREWRSPTTLRLLFAARWVVALTVGVGSLGALYSWGTSPTNLALHRHATASSQAFGTTPEGAVDGISLGLLGFHSSNDGDPWLAIDLGRIVNIREVRALGRSDCCYDQSVPLAFEASSDGSHFRRVAVRTESFSQSEPWSIEPRSLAARFVRFHTLRDSVLVLSEVQVFGR